MKWLAFFLVLAGVSRASEPGLEWKVAGAGTRHEDFPPSTEFIFFAVLEGLYEDGVSDDDAGRILMREGDAWYYHFIYACPICSATIAALETYQRRPENPFRLKFPASTFGPGLPESLHRQLWSDDARDRLRAINALVGKWIARRLDTLPEGERKAMVGQLKEAREQGTTMLESFRNGEHGPEMGVKEAAPAYENLSECAACNGAVGMKLPED